MSIPQHIDPEGVSPQEKWEALRKPAGVQYVLLVGNDPAAVSEAFAFPLLKCDANGHLITARAPNSGVTFQKVTEFTLTPTQLDIGFLGANRDDLIIWNHSSDWLFIKLGGPPAPTTDFTTVVKGFSEWRITQSDPLFGGPVWGVWNNPIGSGRAICTELT